MCYKKIPQDEFLSDTVMDIMQPSTLRINGSKKIRFYDVSYGNLIINFFSKTYKRHTNFALEKKEKNKSLTFGKTFSFSPLSHCANEYDKNIAIQCLQNRPSNWWCIYDACISPSKPKFHYIKI